MWLVLTSEFLQRRTMLTCESPTHFWVELISHQCNDWCQNGKDKALYWGGWYGAGLRKTPDVRHWGSPWFNVWHQNWNDKCWHGWHEADLLRKTRSSSLWIPSRLPCYVFCICLLTYISDIRISWVASHWESPQFNVWHTVVTWWNTLKLHMTNKHCDGIQNHLYKQCMLWHYKYKAAIVK